MGERRGYSISVSEQLRLIWTEKQTDNRTPDYQDTGRLTVTYKERCTVLREGRDRKEITEREHRKPGR